MTKPTNRPNGASRALQLARITIVCLATALAFFVGLQYATNRLAQTENGTRFAYQRLMDAAVNFACTGHFANIHLAPYATPADRAAFTKIKQFLQFEQPTFACRDFPIHVFHTGFLDGIDAANVEIPMYLNALYAVVWYIGGVNWQSTYYVIGLGVAIEFIVVLICLRAFVSSLTASILSFLFVTSPFIMCFSVYLRDMLKFPFAICIAALAIYTCAKPRPPSRFVLLAGAIGLLTGIGYGFRSDIYLFLFPAALAVGLFGRVALKGRGFVGLAKNALARTIAVASLFVMFVAGGWMPLLNDGYLHPQAGYGDIGFHPMAMGLLGHWDVDLFQSHGSSTGYYMFRNDGITDLAVGVRVMENAERRHGQNVQFALNSYWPATKRYYLDVVSLIPADMISAAIGGAVNLMTVPASLRFAQTQTVNGQLYDAAEPWTKAYYFAGTLARALTALDSPYRRLTVLPANTLFAANFVIFVLFTALLISRLGLRAALALLLILGSAIAVTSWKFELRHSFYILVFPVVAWASVVGLIMRTATAAVRRRGARGAASTSRRLAISLGSACGVLIILAVSIFAALESTRQYQTKALRTMMVDWSKRATVSAQTDSVERTAGITRIRVLSPIPLTNGSVRAPNAPLLPHVEMGVVAVDVDGRSCAPNPIRITAVGDATYPDNAFRLFETFTTPGNSAQYRLFFPVFFFNLRKEFTSIDMSFSGLDVQTRFVPCIKDVRLVTEFRKDDTLFDFMMPKDMTLLRPQDLFQQINIPGLGYL